MNERIVKVILVSVSSVKGYSRWEWRAVECEIGQAGYNSNRGVRVIFNSGPLYRPTASKGKGPQAKRSAIFAAEAHIRNQFGLPHDADISDIVRISK